MRDLFFFIGEALNGMRRSALMIVLSVATITVSLIVFGIFLLLTVNMNHLAGVMTSKLEIRVYLNDGLTRPEMSRFEAELAKIPAVRSVVFIDKAEAWESFKLSYPTMGLSSVLDKNPLPHSFRVLLHDPVQLLAVAEKIRGQKDWVDDVAYGDILAEHIQTFSKYARYAGYILVGLLTFATLLIIMNTIRLTVIARQTEIEIMQLVGATDQFVRAPFIVEGFMIGVLGAVLSVFFLRPMYTYVAHRFQESIPYFPLLYEGDVLTAVYGAVFLVGIFLGTVGAFIAVSRSLKTTF